MTEMLSTDQVTYILNFNAFNEATERWETNTLRNLDLKKQIKG